MLQTLSEHAAVTRAICKVDERGLLETLVEATKVEREGDGARYVDEAGQTHHFAGDAVVSMNFWGFTPSVFGHLERHLARFLELHAATPGTSECLIPVVVGELIKEKAATVRVLPTSDTWFGVTHPEDKPNVMKTIHEMVARGEYPSPIWDQRLSGGGESR